MKIKIRDSGAGGGGERAFLSLHALPFTAGPHLARPDEQKSLFLSKLSGKEILLILNCHIPSVMGILVG